MKTATAHLTFNTPNRRELIRITEDVQANDDEPGLHEDVIEWLDKVAPPSWMPAANGVAEELLPRGGDYRHHRGGVVIKAMGE